MDGGYNMDQLLALEDDYWEAFATQPLNEAMA